MNAPIMPSAQAPAVVLPSGAISREWFVFLAALLSVVTAQEARITALEAKAK